MSLEAGSDDAGLEGDVLEDLFLPVYRWVFNEDGDFVDDLSTKLAQARMADNVELYLARSLAYGSIAGGVLAAVGIVLGWSLFAFGVLSPDVISTNLALQNDRLIALLEALRVPAAILFVGVVLGTVGFGAGFGSLVAIPYSRASARKREINMLLSDSVSFMYALSVGGLNQLEIIEAMAQAEDTYGEVAKEFQSITQETEYFGTDYRNAIRDQAAETPSEELSQFLTDMLSIVNSGGDMEAFLDDKKQKHMRTAKQQQEMTLETLELFGEMYMTLSLFPLLLIIILVIMSMLGNGKSVLLLGTVYALIPLTGVGFLVLVSTVKQDEPGDGYLMPDDATDRIESTAESGVLNLGLINQYTGRHGVFNKIKSKERGNLLREIAAAPHLFLRDHPLWWLIPAVPLALALLAGTVATGIAPVSWGGMKSAPVVSTFFLYYLPSYVVLLPLAFFYEWNVRSRRAVITKLSENLRKLSSANDTGQTLLESLRTVSETSSGRLADEFETMYAKVNYGMSLKEAMVEFNNTYHIPRMARTVKLISKAQEASSQITDVLSTAAQASENQDDIERERKSRTRMQVAIILMTYLTLLGVMAILKTQFLDVMAGLTEQASGGGGSASSAAASGGASFGANIDSSQLSLLFFHAVTIQAVLSGLISGYIRTANVMSGVKFVVILQSIALVTWVVVG
ncbi:MAG: type II secretion system F family protein [Haloferacaceae archaeon]